MHKTHTIEMHGILQSTIYSYQSHARLLTNVFTTGVIEHWGVRALFFAHSVNIFQLVLFALEYIKKTKNFFKYSHNNLH